MKGVDIARYRTLIFDCDGVLLNSNRVKTEAFYKAALPYGEHAAQMLVNYHVANGGISRYKKFELFLKEMAPEGANGPDLSELLERFAEEVGRGLACCDIASGLQELREATASTRWMVVSGGDQRELRRIFRERMLDTLFDGGIFGSPDTKEEILHRESENSNIKWPAIFLGDSKYDYLAASNVGMDFVFISQWTEFREWPEYCAKNCVEVAASLEALICK